MDMLQTSVEMTETNLSVVFLPYNLPFPVCPLHPLEGALLATAVWQWNQVAHLKYQPVLCAHRTNSAATSLCTLETLAGRNPLPVTPSRISLFYPRCTQVTMQVFGHMQLPLRKHLSLPTLYYPCPQLHPLALLYSPYGEAQHCPTPMVMPFPVVGALAHIKCPLSGLVSATVLERGERPCRRPWLSSCATRLKGGERRCDLMGMYVSPS